MKYLAYIWARFPLIQTLPLAGFFGFGVAVSVGAIVGAKVSVGSVLLVSLALFLFLFQLRLFDDIKDADHDGKFHKHRPVPKGEIAVRELLNLSIIVIAIELALAYSQSGGAVVMLSVAIVYALLLFLEGVTIDVLRKYFGFYIFIHELLLLPVLMYMFVLSGVSFAMFLQKEVVLLLVAYVGLFFLIEVGRKIKGRKEESGGLDSYTEQYGVAGAVVLLCGTGVASATFLLLAARSSEVLASSGLVGDVLLFLVIGLLIFGARFAKDNSSVRAKQLFGYTIFFTASLLSLLPIMLIV